jgi:ribokinase
MNAPPHVVVVGSCNMDIVASGPHLPQAGQTVLMDTLATVPGGKGANQAIAVARAGAASVLLAAVGRDPAGDQILAALVAAGVDTAAVRRVEGPSGTAMIMVGADGENLIAVVAGANACLTRLSDEERATIAGAAALLLQLEIPMATVTEAAEAGRAAGAMVVLNAAPPAQLSAELIAAVDVLVVNQSEAESLSGDAGSQEAALRLLESVPQVVVTLGAGGALFVSRDAAPLTVHAPQVQAIDATGAGDVFVGFLAAALAEGRPVADAARRSCSAASISVERLGASASIPTRAEMEARLAEWYGR